MFAVMGLPNGFAKKPDSGYVKTKIDVCQGKKAKNERKKEVVDCSEFKLYVERYRLYIQESII